MQDKYLLAIAGIICITFMETGAIICGTDGTYLSMCVGAIAAIVGAVVGVSVNLTRSK